MVALDGGVVERQNVEHGPAPGVTAFTLEEGQNGRRRLGQAALFQSSTTLPDWPDRMASKPSSNRS